jgi:phosphoribosylpyrophosphate synthetase
MTAVAPDLAYGRKDWRTQRFGPVSLRVVAQCFEAAGCTGLITLEAHLFAAVELARRQCRNAQELGPDAAPAARPPPMRDGALPSRP